MTVIVEDDLGRVYLGFLSFTSGVPRESYHPGRYISAQKIAQRVRFRIPAQSIAVASEYRTSSRNFARSNLLTYHTRHARGSVWECAGTFSSSALDLLALSSNSSSQVVNRQGNNSWVAILRLNRPSFLQFNLPYRAITQSL